MKTINSLTEAKKAKMPEWADKWIEIGLRTGRADREKFEAAAQKCYEYAGIPWPGRVVWVSSPLVMALAAPTAALVHQYMKRDAVRDAVDGAVGGAVGDAVRGAVGDAVDGAVGGAVGDAVDGAVGDAVDGAVGGAVGQQVIEAIRRGWSNYIGGQFWCGGWYWGTAFTSFFREICNLELSGNLWLRGKAYEETIESTCWWYPHRDFVMAVERPRFIHRELTNPAVKRGLGSHRLHCDDGPAVAWDDGFGVYAIHGVNIPFKKRYIVEQPGLITVSAIEAETNAEIRRIMIGRFGYERYLKECKAVCIDSCAEDHVIKGLRTAKLHKIGDDIILLDMLNSTPEPDGTVKRYILPIDADRYDGEAGHNCWAAMASTWRIKGRETELLFKRYQDYRPAFES